MREERPFLDVVVGDELKAAPLGKDGGFVVDGTIFEMESGARVDQIAMRDLHEIAGSEHGSVVGSQFEESVNGSSQMVNGHGIRGQSETAGGEQDGGERTGSDSLWRSARHIPFLISKTFDE